MTTKFYLMAMLLMAAITSYSQETTPYLKSSCLNDNTSVNKLDSDCPPGVNFMVIGDTLRIYGTIEANCCGTHLASITRNEGLIVVTTTDTGDLCKCECNYCFEIKLPGSTKDTIVRINDKTYNPKYMSTGISDIDKGLVKVFPNPTAGLLTIDFLDSRTETAKIEVYDMQGIELLDKNINISSNIIDISSLSKGFYILKIMHDSKLIFSKQIVKQ